MPSDRVRNIYPLTPTQEGMLFHHLAAEDPLAYVQQISYHVRGRLDPVRFEAAWNRLILRHDILRTAFVHTNSKRPLQVVYKDGQLDFTLHGAGTDPAAIRAAALRTPFDPARARLMRIDLVPLAEAEFEVIWSHHHLITDGWSIGILQNELVEIYQALSEGREPNLPPAPPFSQHVRYLESLDQQAGAAYWRDYLAGYSQTASLPAGRAASGEVREVVFRVPAHVEARMRNMGVTANTILQSIWGILLAGYSRSTDVVFGTVVSGRPPAVPGVDHMVGLFVNTVPLRIRVRPEQTYGELAATVQRDAAAREPHQYFPLARAQSESELKQHLFTTLTAMENYPVEEQLQATSASQSLGFAVENVRVFEKTHYGFVVQFLPSSQLLVKLQYDTGLFSESFTRQIGEHFLELLDRATADPSIPIARLQRAIAEPPAASAVTPVFESVRQRVERHAARDPQASALTCDGVSITYGELDAGATRLAQRLRALGVTRESRIGVCCERSPALITAMLGIWKAGGAYVPLDPAYPPERLAYLIADSEMSLVIADETGARALPPGTVILPPDAPAPEHPEPLPAETHPEQAAYIIYTSGSTGKPKGCTVTHANVASLFSATESLFHLTAADVWTMFHSAAFDFSVWEIWGALSYGGRLVIVPYWISRSPADFRRLLAAERVTILNQTPSAFRQLLADGRLDDTLSLRLVIFGGEALNPRSLRPWFESPLAHRAQLVNMYGITETTVHVTHRVITGDDADADSPASPIGVPISSLSIALDAPSGAPGEIHVGGAGVCRGYWRRPALTAERFVPDPNGPPGARVYRSGDLARRLPSGELDYIGRADQQVKIRGFRIEPGEIEAVLAAQPGVREAFVLAAPSPSGARLIAYVTGSAEGLLEAIRRQLPDYMLPSAIVELERMPLTVHGKIDRKALPDPAAAIPAAAATPPRNAVEAAIAGSWSQALGIPAVGIRDNYLALGGDSITAIRVVSALLQRGYKIGVRDLFRYPTIEELAPYAEPVERPAAAPAPASRGPLSPIQEHFLATHTVDPHWFNHSVTLDLTGFTATQIQKAWNVISERHAALRMRFTQDNGVWTQEPAAPAAIIETVPSLDADFHQGFDIAKGPLVRLIHCEPQLRIIVHHLVIDAVSWRILLEDLGRLLTGAPLDPPTASFVQWCAALRQSVPAAKPEWPASQPLPFAGAQAPNLYGDVETVNFRLTEAETEDLLQKANAAYGATAEELQLAALALALRDWTGAPSASLLLESHGRSEPIGNVDISRTVGWFTAIFPLEVTVSPDPGDAVKRTKEALRRIPRHGMDYAASMHLTPANGVRFNYLGAPGAGGLRACTADAGQPVSPRAPRPVALDISSVVADGRLEASIAFSRRQFQQESIRQFADGFHRALQQVLAHCRSRTTSEVTPSDFTYSDLTLDEFDRMFS